MKKYWLFKSEPSTFSIDDLKNCPNQTEHWDGVRNYQARNFMQAMQIGDLGFFYHSNCKVPAIVGIVEIVTLAYPDFTAWDVNSAYYDAKSTLKNPRWFMVEVKLVEILEKPLSLQLLKQQQALKNLALVKKGNRLSIMPLSLQEWTYILNL